MGIQGGPDIVEDGLVLYLDAANKRSYPGSGITWYDLSGNNFNFTIDDRSGNTWNNNGYFGLAGGKFFYRGVITPNSFCTLVFWIKTTDTQALFWRGQTTSYYLGAYRVDNKEYYSNFGTPNYFQDTIEKSNIYDNLIDGQWHMVEFKNVDMVSITENDFNRYASFTFDDGSIGVIQIYNRNLTTEESTQNFNALRGRFGI